MEIREICCQVRRDFEAIEDIVRQAAQQLSRLVDTDYDSRNQIDSEKANALARMLESFHGLLLPDLQKAMRRLLAEFACDPATAPQTVPDPHDPETSKANAFARELEAFHRLLPDLLKGREGYYVAMRDGLVIDQDANDIQLAERVCLKYPDDYVLVRKVQRDEPCDVFIPSPHVVET